MSNYSESNVEPSLIEVGEDWEKEWRGMPEFVQKKQKEYAKIIIRFRNEEDLQDFANRIGQKLNRKSQCTWHPAFQRSNVRRKYVNES